MSIAASLIKELTCGKEPNIEEIICLIANLEHDLQCANFKCNSLTAYCQELEVQNTKNELKIAKLQEALSALTTSGV